MATISGKQTKTVAYFTTAFKHWFENSGKTQQQAALELETSQGAINNLLSGERAPSVGHMEKIAATLLNLELLEMLLLGKALMEKPSPHTKETIAPSKQSLQKKLAQLDRVALRTIEQVVELAILAQAHRLGQTGARPHTKNTAVFIHSDTKAKQGFVYVEDVAEGGIVDSMQVTEIDELVVSLDKFGTINRDDPA